MNYSLRMLVVSWWAIGLSVLAPAPAAAAETITISGTGTALGTMKQLIAAFERSQAGVRLRMLPSVGSAGAIKAVARGALDIGLTGRQLTPDERSLPIRSLDYARTPFVFAVNRKVADDGLTAAEVARIYHGQRTTWGDGTRVRIILRPAHDADTIIARAISPEMRAAVDAALGRDGMVMAITNQECHDLLSRMPGSIGFSSLTQILTDGHPLKPLAWNGVAPTVANLANGSYPLGKTLSFIVQLEPRPAVRAFLRFVSSAEGQRILERTGNVPVHLPSL